MALINCPECGQKISEKAPKCPHCGVALNGDSLTNTFESTQNDTFTIVENSRTIMIVLSIACIIAGLWDVLTLWKGFYIFENLFDSKLFIYLLIICGVWMVAMGILMFKYEYDIAKPAEASTYPWWVNPMGFVALILGGSLFYDMYESHFEALPTLLMVLNFVVVVFDILLWLGVICLVNDNEIIGTKKPITKQWP